LCEAVIRVEPERPNVIPFEFEKTIVPEVAVCVPPWIAAIPAAAPGFTVAVIVDPFIPKETPFEFEKTIVPAFCDEPAADTATPPADGSAADREMVKPLEALAVVPERFVSTRVGSPWEWFDAA
jgi:hypothetical protein